MKRTKVTLAEVADYDNLAQAVWRAGRGKRHRAEVQSFLARLQAELASLQADILSLQVEVGRYQTFEVWDPKPRLIHAPCFRERVLHHALMAKLGPALDRALIDDTYACRVGKGTYAAALRAQQHVRRFPWYGKIDVRSFFASIEHRRLVASLGRRFKGAGVLALCERIITGHQQDVGRGLPIGALTSQHFANLYLDPMDRFLLQERRVRGLVRYMDDSAFFCDTKSDARFVMHAVTAFAQASLGLTLRDDRRIQRSALGLPFVGFRIFPGAMRLSRRRAARYRKARRDWERAFLDGAVDHLGLQAGYASALAITAHVDSRGFRNRDLQRLPPPDA